MTATPSLFPKGLLSDILPAGHKLWRIHRSHRDALHFSVGQSNRFDAPNKEFGVLYLAADQEGAFVETVLRRTGRLIAYDTIRTRSWAEVVLGREVTVARLHGDGLLWHGHDASISSRDDYGESRRLSCDLFHRFPNLDGIAYRSRHDNDRMCYALFNRASAALTVQNPSLLDTGRPLVDRLLAKYGADLDFTSLPSRSSR